LTISVDIASANDTAIDWFKKRTVANKEVVCRHEFIHVRCSAHILNLIVHEGLKNVNHKGQKYGEVCEVFSPKIGSL